LRDLTWIKVERQHLLGLRSPDPETRARFFRLHSARLHGGPVERLGHVIQQQDWEPMGSTFWPLVAMVRTRCQCPDHLPSSPGCGALPFSQSCG
jgi:transformation/transcription domain-associated protein